MIAPTPHNEPHGVDADKKRPKISVCILTYNHGSYIDDCLASVVGQQVDADLEILVGDDYSLDETRKVISAYCARYSDLVISIFHEKNIGGARNYQFLFDKASGDYIAYLDGDDFWLPGKLAKQLAFMERNPRYSAVYTNAIVINNAGELRARFNGSPSEKIDINYLMKSGNFLNSSSMMFRAEHKGAILNMGEGALDYQMNIMLASKGTLGYINSVLVAYRANSTSSVSANKFELVMEHYWKAIICAWKLGAEEDALRNCIRGYYRSLIRTAVVRRKPRAAFQQYKRMSLDCPYATKLLLAQSIMTVPFYVGRDVLKGLARRIFKGGAEILYDR